MDATLSARPVTPQGEKPSRAQSSYFLGNDTTRHISAVGSYDLLDLGEVYPGIAVTLRATHQNVEKVFTVAPHHDPGQIRLRLDGIEGAAGIDFPQATIANPANGDIYVAGFTSSTGSTFPGTAGGAQTSFGGGTYDGFVARLDGNGAIDALTDGLLVLRAMFGLTGTAVTNGAVETGATRGTWASIQAFLNSNCGTGFAP